VLVLVLLGGLGWRDRSEPGLRGRRRGWWWWRWCRGRRRRWWRRRRRRRRGRRRRGRRRRRRRRRRRGSLWARERRGCRELRAGRAERRQDCSGGGRGAPGGATGLRGRLCPRRRQRRGADDAVRGFRGGERRRLPGRVRSQGHDRREGHRSGHSGAGNCGCCDDCESSTHEPPCICRPLDHAIGGNTREPKL